MVLMQLVQKISKVKFDKFKKSRPNAICNSKTLGCRQLFFQQSTLDITLFHMV